ncbi:MAG: hypothetical protein HFF85_02775 [Oscillibacter sp.]|jgi:hypothetical protein|nr:hypothetical protein [Oscillibacter sp.]MCI9375310.1 hypothetical protein [Oscillibacter sp.]
MINRLRFRVVFAMLLFAAGFFSRRDGNLSGGYGQWNLVQSKISEE